MKLFRLNVTPKQFLKDLYNEIDQDRIFDGAAALAFYLMLAIFPAMIFLLSLLPYLPMANIDTAIMDLLRQALPDEAAKLFAGTVTEITKDRKGGLLSVGLLGALYAAVSGTLAIVQQLNVTYDVREGRSFLKVRWVALCLTMFLGVLIVSAFGLIVLGGNIQEVLAGVFGRSSFLLFGFAALRWVIIVVAMLTAFATAYFYGPDVEQRFKFITPGSILGTVLIILASVAFREYVVHFGTYNSSYGGLGAAIVLLMWFYLTGIVFLLGSEINALIEHYSTDGKQKGEKVEGENSAPGKPPTRPTPRELPKTPGAQASMVSQFVELKHPHPSVWRDPVR